MFLRGVVDMAKAGFVVFHGGDGRRIKQIGGWSTSL